jgi:hypothetical protein
MRRTLSILLGVSFAGGAAAHHSPAIYDLQKTITLTGSVVKYEWSNPHVYVVIRATQAGAAWEIETGSPTMMERAGWFEHSLRVNDQVIVEVSPAKNSARRVALLSSLRKSDGSFAYRRGSLAPAERPTSVAASSLSGNWLPKEPAFVRFLGPTGEWPLTERGRVAQASHTDAKNQSQDCVSLSAPFLMAWSDLKQIEVGSTTTVIRAALIDDVERVIHMSARSHEGAKPTSQGHSIGRFENGVLIVDTTDFSPHASGIRDGVPSGPRKHLVERFQLSSDRTRLTYSYELTDPDYLVKPVTGRVEWVHRPDLRYTRYKCDRELAGRFLAK